MAMRLHHIAIHQLVPPAEQILHKESTRYPERVQHPSKEHPTRTAIVACLKKNPGLNLKSICEAVDANRGTATHHLQALSKPGAVASIKSGREREFFLAGLDRRYLRLRGPTGNIAAAVARAPGMIQKALSKKAALGRNTQCTHMDRLVDHGLVDEVPDGRARRYYPTQRLVQFLDHVEPCDSCREATCSPLEQSLLQSCSK